MPREKEQGRVIMPWDYSVLGSQIKGSLDTLVKISKIHKGINVMWTTICVLGPVTNSCSNLIWSQKHLYFLYTLKYEVSITVVWIATPIFQTVLL